MNTSQLQDSLINLHTFCTMLEKDYTKCKEKNVFEKKCQAEGKNYFLCVDQYLLLWNTCGVSQNSKPKIK